VIAFQGQVYESPVREGSYLFAAWNVPNDLPPSAYPLFVRWIT
jgi:hypothetical protein